MRTTNNEIKTSVVLVHGAWADGSSWRDVIYGLSKSGFSVQAAQIPLESFEGDIEKVRSMLRRVQGPVIVAGHSYGAAVVSQAATDLPNVKGLVFITGIVPDEGETVGEVFRRNSPHASAPALEPDERGFLWLSARNFKEALAQNATADQIELMASVQKPISATCLGVKSRKPAWKSIPSWSLVATDDRMLSPETQRSVSKRAGSNIVELKVDHMPLLTATNAVVDLISKAAQ